MNAEDSVALFIILFVVGMIFVALVENELRLRSSGWRNFRLALSAFFATLFGVAAVVVLLNAGRVL